MIYGKPHDIISVLAIHKAYIIQDRRGRILLKKSLDSMSSDFFMRETGNKVRKQG